MSDVKPGPFAQQAQEQSERERFVRAWLKSGDPFKAGLEVWPKDTGRALRASWEWPNDPKIMELRTKLLTDEGERAFLPTKEETARDVYALAGMSTRPIEERLKGYRLYAEIMGFIDKPAPTKLDNANGARPYTFVLQPYADAG